MGRTLFFAPNPSVINDSVMHHLQTTVKARAHSSPARTASTSTSHRDTLISLFSVLRMLSLLAAQ